jgi:hypothetical protein
VAIPEEQATEGIHELNKLYNIQLMNCVSMPASVAGLLKQLGDEAFIVLLVTRDKAYVLGVHNGTVLFIQGMPLDYNGEIETEAAMHAISFGRQNLDRNFGIEESRFLCMGEARKQVVYGDLGEENWIPDWSHCLAAESDDILQYPALFGTLFTTPSYSYLPEEYKLAFRLLKLNTFLVAGAGIGAVILAYLSYQNMQKLDPLRAQLQRDRQQLSSHINSVQQQIPDQSGVAKVQSYLKIEENVAAQPSISHFLQQLSTVVPTNVTLLTMEIKRRAAEDNNQQEGNMVMPVAGQSGDMGMEKSDQASGAKAKAEILLDQDLIVHFNCSSTGDYSRVKARFDKALKGFSSLFLLGTVDWSYDEKSKTGLLNCELLLNREEK